MNLTKAEVIAALGIKHSPKTATATTPERVDLDVSALSATATEVYYGDIIFSKQADNKGASASVKYGLTVGAGQIEEHHVHINSNDGAPKKLENVLFSSLSCINMNARFTGYKMTVA